MTTQHISVTVNGAAHEADVEPRLLLVHFLRDTLGLTGTHVGCDTSNCGACTVHVDGESAKSCTMLAVQADGRERQDHRGDGRRRRPSTRSSRRSGTSTASSAASARPGMIMQAAWLLGENADPTEEEIREGISGNLCRCTGYVNIVKAIQQAAGEMQAAAETQTGTPVAAG